MFLGSGYVCRVDPLCDPPYGGRGLQGLTQVHRHLQSTMLPEIMGSKYGHTVTHDGHTWLMMIKKNINQ